MSDIQYVANQLSLRLKKNSSAIVKVISGFWAKKIQVQFKGQSENQDITIIKEGNWWNAERKINGKVVLKLSVVEYESKSASFYYLDKLADFINNNTSFK